jgi:hypothetical protein
MHVSARLLAAWITLLVGAAVPMQLHGVCRELQSACACAEVQMWGEGADRPWLQWNWKLLKAAGRLTQTLACRLHCLRQMLQQHGVLRPVAAVCVPP